eukprot:NODE_187_length_13529_cov_1.102606.p5 type:complete len:366 gc:universal NODE_187_length_13529_cov_1.102606:2119-3216(+)
MNMNQTGSVIIGYASMWTPLDFSKIPADKLTHIIFSFLNINSDGNLIFGDDSCNSCCAINFLNSLFKLKSQHPNLKVQVSVGGATWKSSFSVVKDDNKRKVLVKSVSDLLTQYQIDGIDIDWEFPDANEGGYFGLLAKDLRESLGNEYLITCAVPSSSTLLSNYKLQDSKSYFNWINLMTYDASVGSGVATFHSPLYHNPNDPIEDQSVDSAVKTLKSYGITNDKIVIGVPLYGYTYQVSKNDASHGLFKSCSKNCDVNINDKDISIDSKNVRYFDDKSKSPYLYNSDTGVFTTYEDTDSVNYKVEYVNSNNYKGIMFWEIGLDNLFVKSDKSVLLQVTNSLNNVNKSYVNGYALKEIPLPSKIF